MSSDHSSPVLPAFFREASFTRRTCWPVEIDTTRIKTTIALNARVVFRGFMRREYQIIRGKMERHLFGSSKSIVGMLHVPALPGSPQNTLEFKAIVDWVLKDAEALAGAGVDGWILENFGDAPFYPRRVPAHTVAFMTAIGCEVRRRFDLPLGINVLRNDAESALAVASAVGAE